MTLRVKDTIEGKISNATNADTVPWSGVSGKPSTFTPSSHTHDDRYYTESEINSKLSGKANSSHTHTKSQITDFPTSMPASDVYSWAKQPSKPSYTANEVGAFPSQTIDMPSTEEARYYLLATVTAQKWGNYRCSFSINSRHSGCGMVTVAFGNNTGSLIHNNMYAQIYYYGTTNQVTDSQIFQVYGSADGKNYYLFAKSWDYNGYTIRAFASDFVLSRGDALTSIPTNTYGTLLCNTTINPSNSVSWNDVSGKPSTYTPSSHTHSKSEVGLGNVDNTADSTKSVKYAAWANGADYANYAFSNNGVSTSGNGSAYEATISGFSLATGKSIVMIPNVTSTTTTPTLNVNGTGAKNIRMRLSSSTSSTIPLINSKFLTQYKPVKVTYDGTYWVIDDFIQPDANNLYGTLISSGSSAPSSGTAGFIYIQTT